MKGSGNEVIAFFFAAAGNEPTITVIFFLTLLIAVKRTI